MSGSLDGSDNNSGSRGAPPEDRAPFPVSQQPASNVKTEDPQSHFPKLYNGVSLIDASSDMPHPFVKASIEKRFDAKFQLWAHQSKTIGEVWLRIRFPFRKYGSVGYISTATVVIATAGAGKTFIGAGRSAYVQTPIRCSTDPLIH
jgi:hypothetical protein